jgi:transposase
MADLMSDPHVEELQQQIRRLTEENERLLEERVQMLEDRRRLFQENTLLRQKLDALARRIFGRSSEQLNENQVWLLLQEAQAPGPALGKGSSPEVMEAEPPARKKVSAQQRRPRVPENLPVIEEVLVPEEVKAQPAAWRRMGEEISDQLDYEPARFLWRRTVRPKYVQHGQVDAVPVIAALPQKLQERGLAAPGLLAQILVGKFCDHLPFYRQQSIYSRSGVWLPRQTMSRWVDLAAEWLRPIYEAVRVGVMKGGYVQVDESPIQYLAPGHGQTKQGYLWVCHRPGGDVVFHWSTSRAAACLEKIVPVDFSGKIQCDGYSAYPAFARQREQGAITLAGCWAHARRGFHEARAEAPQLMGWILRQIQHLYAVESQLRHQRAGPALREAVRSHQSCPILDRLHRLIVTLKTKGRFLPQSLAGKAIDYALGQWSALQVYLSDARIEIDNNLVENAIRPTAVGKKNWLFFGHAEAGERSAIIYTIIESCRRRGIDPNAYLRDILTRLPYTTNWQIRELTPEAWAKAQRSAPLAAAA